MIQVSFSFFSGPFRHAFNTLCVDTIKPWASIVGNRLVDTLNEVSSTEKTVLVIVANNSIESLVTIFAAVLFNIPVRIIQQDPLLRTSYLESMLRAANPFAILVSDEDIMKDVLFEKYTPNLKLILYTGNALQGILPKSIKVTKWDEFMITGDNNPQAHWAKTFPAPDTESPLLGTVFMNKASGVPVERLTPSISTFSNNQIMTAILSQRAFIPKEAQWNPQDKLLVFTAACNMYTLIYQLAALVEGVSLSYIAGQDVSFYETIQILRPTILVCDDFTSWLILSYSKGLGIFSDISFAMNMSSLSRGTLKRSAAIDFLNSVRFIYTYQNIYPYLQVKMESGEGKEMNQVHCNALRALTGAAVFHGLISPLVAGPICQTTIADYRTDDGPTSLGRYEDGQDVVASTTFINLGPPMPSIEYKVSDFPGSQLADQFNLGMLQVRGTTTCTSSGTWVDTGIMAHIGSDGCVKILFRKVDHPNQEGKKKVVEKQYELMKLHELKIQESEDKHRVVKEGVDSQTEKQYPEQRAGFI